MVWCWHQAITWANADQDIYVAIWPRRATMRSHADNLWPYKLQPYTSAQTVSRSLWEPDRLGKSGQKKYGSDKMQ